MTTETAKPAGTLASCPLSTRGVLTIAGPDSRKFLQGQCTADIQNLDTGKWTLAGFCTPKGRLYANGYLAALTEDHYWLILPGNMVADTLQRLQKYAAFFKTELRDASKQWHGLVCLHSTPSEPLLAAGDVRTDDCQVTLGLANNHQMIWLNPLEESRYEQTLAQIVEATCFPESHWDAIEIEQGFAWIVPETIESFVPQALAWDELGGVSYQKGCYTGQEVVARLHYKGASKKQLRHIHGSGAEPTVGAALMSATDKVMGNVVRVSPTEKDKWQGLAAVNVATAEPDHRSLHLEDHRSVSLDSWVVPINKEN